MKKIIMLTIAAVSLLTLSSVKKVQSNDRQYYWMKVKAQDKFQRSIIANTGAAIEIAQDDYVIAYGSDLELKAIQKLGWLEASSNLAFEAKDFPTADAPYHNYAELTSALHELADKNSDIVQLSSFAKTNEGRDMWVVRITSDLTKADTKPAVIYMGGHHAREHLSVELPLMWAQYLVNEYRNGNAKVISLIQSRDIHIIPTVNPDGMEYDIQDGQYKMWRKNRGRNADGTYGVDLNRNYSYQWGTGGSSSNTTSEVYMGPKPFSEVETIAMKDYIEAHTNITTLLSLHSYSKLVLYPWGHKYDGIPTPNDKAVHETMAKTMAKWNGYTPEQTSELYIASGDTTDWAYGVHKIISFTFELDPSGAGFGGGFYPGAGVIQPVFQKNVPAFMYLLEYSDNPYRVLTPTLTSVNH